MLLMTITMAAIFPEGRRDTWFLILDSMLLEEKSATVTENFSYKVNFMGHKMAQALRARAALPKDLGSVPSTHNHL